MGEDRPRAGVRRGERQQPTRPSLPRARRPRARPSTCSERVLIDNLLVRIHFIIVMIRWTGLTPWEFEFPFPGLSGVAQDRLAAAASAMSRATSPPHSARAVPLLPSPSSGVRVSIDHFPKSCGPPEYHLRSIKGLKKKKKTFERL